MVVVLGVVILGVGFVAFCLVDVARSDAVRYLPRWAWVVIICVSIPLGGIAYLAVGRGGHVDERPDSRMRPLAETGRLETVSLRVETHRAAVLGGTGTIEVHRLSKHFGSVVAVDDLSFTVLPGRVTGFLGPNGAGKTTAMRVVLGLESATSGTASIAGRIYRDLVRPLHQVGCLLDANAVHPGRSAWLHIVSVAQSNGIGPKRVEEVMELSGLSSVAHRRVGEFSLGMKQRLGIAIALLGDPPVLLFDEPVNGLDPEGIHWIRQLFKAWGAEGRTVFVSSHLMSEMALTADHLIIIGRGRLLADSSTEDFVAANSRKDVLVRSPQADTLSRLLVDAGAGVIAESDGALAVTGMDAPTIAQSAAREGLDVHELTPRHASLEEAYLDLTRDSVQYRATGEARHLEAD
jgi:ABC-2 type transport system ATP-binding protein